MQQSTDFISLEIEYSQINEPDSTFIDCRTKQEFENGHLPNAINLPLQHLSILKDSFPCSKKDTFFVYCKSGNRSYTFVTYLRSLGYSKCQSIVGGYEQWETKTNA